MTTEHPHGRSGAESIQRARKPLSLRLRRAGTTLLALIFCVVWFFPVYWMVITSFKPISEVMTATPSFWPSTFIAKNYFNAMFLTSFFENLRNSVIVTACVVVFSVVVAFLACYALTQFRFHGRKAIMVVILGMQMIPAGLLIPQFVVFNRLGLLNTYLGLILAYISAVLPFSIWVLRGFFLAVPREIFEAAQMDGANDWRILWSIMFPLIAPGLVSTSVFAFINAWNDYLTAYTFMKDQSMYTLPVWLASFSTPQGTDYAGQMAASVIFSLPVVIFFMIIQRHVVTGITAGSVK